MGQIPPRPPPPPPPRTFGMPTRSVPPPPKPYLGRGEFVSPPREPSQDAAYRSEIAELTAEVLALREELKDMRDRKNAAYEERNRVVAVLSTVFPSGHQKTDIEGWSDDWHNCVFIDTPVGQASWHIHDSQMLLFTHLRPYVGKWDGHTTEEKYRRLDSLVKTSNSSGQLRVSLPKEPDFPENLWREYY